MDLITASKNTAQAQIDTTTNYRHCLCERFLVGRQALYALE